MHYSVTYTRTLTLTETIEADSVEDIEKQAELRYGQLSNSDYDEADGSWDIEPLTVKLYSKVKVMSQDRLADAIGKVVSFITIRPGTPPKAMVDFGTVSETFNVDELDVLPE